MRDKTSRYTATSRIGDPNKTYTEQQRHIIGIPEQRILLGRKRRDGQGPRAAHIDDEKQLAAQSPNTIFQIKLQTNSHLLKPIASTLEKMQPNIAYLILGALAAITSASPQVVSQESVTSVGTESAPTPQSTVSVAQFRPAAAQADLTVKFCTDAGFKGRCTTYNVTKRVCCESSSPLHHSDPQRKRRKTLGQTGKNFPADQENLQWKNRQPPRQRQRSILLVWPQFWDLYAL
ncbi:MAG: hypothetical protein Q9200_001226 [Gallowayella weberi]